MEIIDKIGFDEVLLQLAEEASELSQAALKLRRARMGINPTPITEGRAERHLLEEIADVLLCCSELYLVNAERDYILKTAVKKCLRWKKRLGILDNEEEEDERDSRRED